MWSGFKGNLKIKGTPRVGLLTLKSRIPIEGCANVFLSSDLYQKHGTDVKDFCCQSDGPREPRICQNSGTRGLSPSLHHWESEFGGWRPSSQPPRKASMLRRVLHFLSNTQTLASSFGENL